MYKIWVLLILAMSALPLVSQSTSPVNGYCNLGGAKAAVSGINSTNYQQGIIPGCTVTVYLHGTLTLATIYADSSNTPLSNPFTANVISSPNSGAWIFWAANGSGYDVVGSGGSNSGGFYPHPVTLAEVFLGGGGGSGAAPTPPLGAAQYYASNTAFGGSASPLDPHAPGFSGADICAKSNSASATLTSGGAINLSGLGAVSCSTTLTVAANITYMLAGTNLTLNGNPGISITGPAALLQGGGEATVGYSAGSSTTILKSGIAAPLIADLTGAGTGLIISDLELDGNSATGTFGAFLPATGDVTLRNVKAQNFSVNAVFAPNGLLKIHDGFYQHSGCDGIVGGSDGTYDGKLESTLNGCDGLHLLSGGNNIFPNNLDFNTGRGLYVDGRILSNWFASTVYKPGCYFEGGCGLIIPTSGNAGGYQYAVIACTGDCHSGGSAPTWNQTPGATITDNHVTWLNTGNTLQTAAYGNHILGGSYPYNGLEQIRVEGSASHATIQTSITGTFLNSAGNTSTSSSMGIHLLYASQTNITGGSYFGSALNLKNDLGCIVVDTGSYATQISDFSGYAAHNNCIHITGSADYTTINNVQVTNNGDNTTSGDARYAILSDSGTVFTVVGSGTTVNDGRSPAYSLGIKNYSTGAFGPGTISNILGNFYADEFGGGMGLLEEIDQGGGHGSNPYLYGSDHVDIGGLVHEGAAYAPFAQVNANGVQINSQSGVASNVTLAAPIVSFTPYQLTFPSTPGTSGQCLATVGGGTSPMTWTTCSGGSGSGTVNSGTIYYFGQYLATGTAISQATNLYESAGQTVLNYVGTGGFSTPVLTTTGSGAGQWTATCSTLQSAAPNGTFSITPPVTCSGVNPRWIAPVGPPTVGQVVGVTAVSGDDVTLGYASPVSGVSSVFGRTGIVVSQPGDYLASQVTNAVDKTAANTYTTGLQNFGSASLKVPIGAGLTTASAALIGYDASNNNFHGGINTQDSIFALTPAGTPINGQCVNWVVTGSNVSQGSVSCLLGNFMSQPITVIHTNGGVSTYTPSTNSDAARGTALITACTSLANLDHIYLTDATFDMSTYAGTTCGATNCGCDLSANGTITASLSGATKGVTTIKGSASNFILVGPGLNGSTTENITCQWTGSSGFDACFGAKGLSTPPTNVILRNVKMIGGTDCFYMTGMSATSGRLDHVSSTCGWDSFKLADNGACAWNIYDSPLTSNGTYGSIVGNTHVYSIGDSTATSSTCKVNIYNSQLTISGGTSGNQGVYVSYGPTVTVHGGIISSSGTVADDLVNDGSHAGTVQYTADLQGSTSTGPTISGAVTQVGSTVQPSLGGTVRTAFPIATRNTSLTTQTILTPSANHVYRVTGDIKAIDGGTGCTGTGTVSATIGYTDADNALAVTKVLVIDAGDSAVNANNVTLPTTAGGLTHTNVATIVPWTANMVSGTPLTILTTYAAGAGCTAGSTGENYAANVIVEQIN
jgi:hypothetical protein